MGVCVCVGVGVGVGVWGGGGNITSLWVLTITVLLKPYSILFNPFDPR